jgi:hypothetical protein
MELNLKQTEIEAALRQYVSGQGFNLTGRAVNITFTSGRTPSGLSALIDIGDVTEVPKSPTLGTTNRTLEARPADLGSGTVTLQLQSDGVASGAAADVSPEPGNVAPEAGEVGESPATPAPEAGETGEATPVTSLFAKPQH